MTYPRRHALTRSKRGRISSVDACTRSITLSEVSLDDAINAIHRQNEYEEREAARKRQQLREEDEKVRDLCLEAAERLAKLGNEEFVRVEPKRRMLWPPYRDPQGGRYAVVSRRRCWVIVDISGIRDSDREAHGPVRKSPVLLLSDGTLGRFWPEPLGLRATSWDDDQAFEYVSSVDLDPAGRDNFSLGSHNSDFVLLVKDRLAHAVVSYERRARG